MSRLIDSAAGVGLVLAVILVLVVDRFVLSRPGAVGANTLPVNAIEGDPKAQSRKLKLAVTPTAKSPGKGAGKEEPWDDMGKLLGELGQGYSFEMVQPEQFLKDPAALEKYDVLFLTCHPGGEELKDALFGFVSKGGILYASDWRYDAVAAAFPDVVDMQLKGNGDPQTLDADVVDSALREILGPKIRLRFELPEWKTAAFAGPRVKNLLQGKYNKFRPQDRLPVQTATAPLMVKFTVNKGTVIFTSFHNEKQNSAVEKKLLHYLIFSLVTAGIDSEISDKMDQGGFTPQRSNLLSTPKRNQSISKTYEHKQPGDLRFALGFRNEGAKLRFQIQSPDGKQYTWDGGSTVILDVPGARTGTWTYTVTDLELPYENFPFTVTVGQKK